ncbi:phytanoyl-CoA dioxygenase [Plenodomus tracheiphilus IPT5]|uniref:Phytanoyl-CoA dioxygenase n=1 Tax=Plenodomus tracheiphilus IPT5 TaxID=1408161 RepID=A0A6A7BCD1_9PLEO|nr:phytanoyl-CoA dioxygenase [Plenodomus tracheiphilus IPT5]
MGSIGTLPLVQRLSASAGIDQILHAYERDGAVILEDFLTESQVKRMNQEFAPGLEQIKPKQDSDLAAFIGTKTKRLPAVINSKTFRDEVLENELMHALSEKILVEGPPDGYQINCAQVIALGPGAEAQPFHRDQGLWSFWEKFPATGPEACINFLCALTPFREENGATRVIPRTHTSMDLAYDDSSESLAAELNPGEALFFSGRLIHRGGHNRTNETRCALTIHLCRNGLNTQEAHPLTIPRDIAETMSYRAQAMFGFRSSWPVHEKSGSHFWTSCWDELGESVGLKVSTGKA